MVYKKHMVLLIFSIILFLFIPALVSAGCCIYQTLGSSCENKASEAQCTTTPQLFVTDDCTDRPECVTGCCCLSDIGLIDVGSTNYSCVFTFIPSPSISPGDNCSCAISTYSISGTIYRMTGGYVSGAIVSAASISTTSATNGAYTINNVPEGDSITVAAHKTSEGCAPNSVTIDLHQDRTGIDINLNCECTPGVCDPNNNAYCLSSKTWKIYDLTNTSQKDEYCLRCGLDDPADCGAPAECVSGDGKCPVTCSPNVDSPKYDSDCVCSMTPNRACPRWCTKDNDADCAAYAAVCGDGLVTYPYETCEDNPQTGQLSLCSPNDCTNPGESGECNCVGLSACGNYIIESGEDCEIGMKCPDGSDCWDCSCGTPQCQGSAMNPSATASFDSSANEILVEWSVLSTCKANVLYYSVFKCEKTPSFDCSSKSMFSPFRLNIPKYQFNITESSVPSNSEFCYVVNATYAGGEKGTSSIKCVSTGHPYCMNVHPDEFCMNNVRSKCDADDNIQPIEDCNPDKFCMGPNRDGKTWCSDIDVCDMCNGLYGMFSNIDLKVNVLEGGVIRPRYCHPGAGRYVVEGCYLDRTKTLFSAFDYCSNIVSCYDYKSQEACEDNADPCGKNQDCEWVWLDNSYHELGGICRPNARELQTCELCDNKDYNWITPACTPEVCALFGDECKYQGMFANPTCTKKSTLACIDYTTQQECIGGTAVHVNAVYNSSGARTGGTHQLTPSNDKFGLGKCYWHAVNKWCLRNADNYPENNQGTYGHDCPLNRRDCESDFINPETIILQSGFSLYPANVRIEYTVNDDTFPRKDIKTYFGLVPAGTPCYPDQLVSGGAFQTLVEDDGDNLPYIVCYYSEDFAKNLELVKSFPINVDANPPVITITSPTESEFKTASGTVVLKGITSIDTMNLCTYTHGSSTKTCINTCFYGQTPCINEVTGEFNITVSVPANGAYDVLFDAEDRAGNQVVGLSLLAIYRNDTQPRKPIIIIEGVQ
ncbi:hypothetical protein AYK26_02565 [Euryarchaeota archaeon SM23-78]|nr:MAG: hypothetical protein AYK26_02565 [Euryarchaeota archaeon SM23-78]MBW3000255.1 carboxypeptidase-like regulatory domain-containing protein [Candidatus Woesearchaeota archaeon]